jgi:hypothetical protein
MLIGGARHALFYEFNDHHLWDEQEKRPTAFGTRMEVRQSEVSFRGLHPDLGQLDLGKEYRPALGFALQARVLRFVKPET